DKIVVLRDGRVEQIGSPMELYNNPANQFVAGFLGSPAMNFLPAELIEPGNPNTLGVRPEDLMLDDAGPLQITTKHVEHLGGDTNVIADCNGHQITVRLFGQHAIRSGQSLRLRIAEGKSYLFDPDGARLS
ncbi:MAG: TOBE domain-containing protein, partial [Pseudomonadota bacterium]|nr:TOBE domain-containing protein [Pseudomonadota bacterium]